MTQVTRVLVNRQAISESRLETATLRALADGEVLIKTGQFALTANNVTYAFAGDQIGYWNFFPADGDQWGIVPVWGFAEVVESRNSELAAGETFWGFLPMASHVVMQPERIRAGGFVDGALHRKPLPVIYNDYVRTTNDPPALAAFSDQRSLLFPLLTTSYLIGDYLQDNDCFAADQVIIGSASSKTGFGTAHYVRSLVSRPVARIGLTSSGNVDFVQSLDLCDQVLAYGDVTTLDPAVPSVFVDMSGDTNLRAAIHNHFGDALKASIGVGATHWDAPRNPEPLPGPEPSFFFAPSQIVKRNAEWGDGVLMRKAQEANVAFVAQLKDRLTISHQQGGDAINSAYQTMANGTTPPSQGLILAF